MTTNKLLAKKTMAFKKASQLSTLCGVDVVLIMYHDGHSNPDVFCSKPDSVNAIINKYLSSKEAAAVVEEKKVEFLQKYGCKEKAGTKIEISKELIGEKSKMVEFDEKSNSTEDVPIDVCGDGGGVNKYGNERPMISSGFNDSYEKAALAVKKKQDEFQEMRTGDSFNTPTEAAIAQDNKKDEFSKIYGFKHSCKTDDNFLEEPNREVELEKTSIGEENVNITACGSEVGESVRGVSQHGNKWRARVYHPKLKVIINLGLHDSYEDAALVVKKKRAELQEMGMNIRQISTGVRRRGYNRWGAQIYHPKLKRHISLGSYDTPEEASIAVENKRAEFAKLHRWTPNVKNGFKNNDKLLEEPIHENVTTYKVIDELTGDLKVPAGARKRKSNEAGATKWKTRVTHYAPEDVLSFNKGTADFSAQSDKANARPKNDCPTSVLCSDNFSMNDQLSDADHSPDISDFEPEISNSADVCERSMMSVGNAQRSGCVSEFDEAMSLGFVNEYGQLLGIYSELDEQMAFSLPDEDVADIECSL